MSKEGLDKVLDAKDIAEKERLEILEAFKKVLFGTQEEKSKLILCNKRIETLLQQIPKHKILAELEFEASGMRKSIISLKRDQYLKDNHLVDHHSALD